MTEKKPDLRLLKLPLTTPLWKPLTPKEAAAYQRDLIYAGRKPRSSYNGWRKDYER